MNTSRIIKFWSPEEGSAYGLLCKVGQNGVTSIELVKQNLGDRTEQWLVVECGDITKHINARQVTEIVWEKDKTNENKETMVAALRIP